METTKGKHLTLDERIKIRESRVSPASSPSKVNAVAPESPANSTAA